MNDSTSARWPVHVAPASQELEIVIEIPRGTFLKRGSTGRVDFISPLPCPFNYGSVPDYLGLEGDLLDASFSDRALRMAVSSVRKRGAR